MNDETTNANTITDLAPVGGGEIGLPVNNGMIDLGSLPPELRLEKMREIIAAKAELNSIGLPQAKSGDLIGFPFAIVDASWVHDMSIDAKKPELGVKDCVNFILRADADNEELGIYTNDLFTCLKSSNKFNDRYVNFFGAIRGFVVEVMEGYTFEKDARYNTAGNDAIVMRKRRPEAKAVGGKSK